MDKKQQESILESAEVLNRVKANQDLNDLIMGAIQTSEESWSSNMWINIAAVILLCLNIGVIGVELTSNELPESTDTISTYFNLESETTMLEEIE